MLEPGRYKGRIKDYGFTSPQAPKQPRAMVQFECVAEDKAFGEDRTDTIMWYGSFNGGALAITLNTLIETLHFKGKDGSELVNGIGSGVLDEDTEYEIEVGPNDYTNDKGEVKKGVQVKYINRPGAARRTEKLEAADAKTFVGGLNLSGELAAMRQKLKAEGKSIPAPGKPAAAAKPPLKVMAQQQPPAAPTIDESEEIPW